MRRCAQFVVENDHRLSHLVVDDRMSQTRRRLSHLRIGFLKVIGAHGSFSIHQSRIVGLVPVRNKNIWGRPDRGVTVHERKGTGSIRRPRHRETRVQCRQRVLIKVGSLPVAVPVANEDAPASDGLNSAFLFDARDA